ncbi:3-dehydroquinate synthase, partial [Cribrihabitans sp. XS_ASV171]
MNHSVRVALGERSYEVEIGPDLLSHAGARIAPLLARRRVAVLTDETVAGLHLEALRAGLGAEGID